MPLGGRYLSAEATSLNTTFNLTVTAFNEAIIATAIRLAIKAYSIEVAPLSSRQKRYTEENILWLQ
jgi:hypothetical protein